MPQRKARLNKQEANEYRARLSHLRNIGVAIGSHENITADPERFTLKQIYHEFARVYEMPGGEVTALVLAKLTVRTRGVMFIDSEMIPSWDDWKLDWDDLRYEKAFLKDLTQGSPIFPPLLLNAYLAGRAAPLGRCQLEGIIIATGHSPIPTNLHDEEPVTMELWLLDERENASCHNFKARIDRSVMRIRSRQRAQEYPAERCKGGGLFEAVEPELKDNFWPAGHKGSGSHKDI